MAANSNTSQIPAEDTTKLQWRPFLALGFLGLHSNLGAKSAPKENLKFFLQLGQNFHQIAVAFRMRLITAAEVFPPFNTLQFKCWFG